MGHALIWIELLASELLLVAVVMAWSARWARPLYQRSGPILLGIILVALAGCLTWVIGWFQFVKGMDFHWFSYTLSWTLCFLAGTIALFIGGFRQRGTEGPAARSWSALKLTVALLVSVLITWTTFSNMDLAVHVQLSAVRVEAGAKLLAGAPPHVTDRDNAALVYQEAFSNLLPADKVHQRWQEKAATWLDVDLAKIDPKDADLQVYLIEQQRSLTLLRQAAALPGCWFDHDYFKGVDMPMPELKELRRGAALLALDALQQAARGEGRRACEDLAALFGIARHFNDPVLISFLTAAKIEKDACKTLEKVLSLTKPTQADLALLALDDKTSYRRYCQRCFQMEEAGIGLSLYALLFAPGLTGSSAAWVREVVGPQPKSDFYGLRVLQSPVYRVFFLADDLAGYRRSMWRIQQLAERPYYEAAADWRALDQSIRERPPGIVAMLILPAAEKCALLAAEADAARQLARLALAATVYHGKHGKYPDKLDDLAQQFPAGLPRDPFDGQPLRMKHAKKDLLFYSIGRDLKDDGGAALEPATNQGDILFRLVERG